MCLTGQCCRSGATDSISSKKFATNGRNGVWKEYKSRWGSRTVFILVTGLVGAPIALRREVAGTNYRSEYPLLPEIRKAVLIVSCSQD